MIIPSLHVILRCRFSSLVCHDFRLSTPRTLSNDRCFSWSTLLPLAVLVRRTPLLPCLGCYLSGIPQSEPLRTDSTVILRRFSSGRQPGTTVSFSHLKQAASGLAALFRHDPPLPSRLSGRSSHLSAPRLMSPLILILFCSSISLSLGPRHFFMGWVPELIPESKMFITSTCGFHATARNLAPIAVVWLGSAPIVDVINE